MDYILEIRDSKLEYYGKPDRTWFRKDNVAIEYHLEEEEELSSPVIKSED